MSRATLLSLRGLSLAPPRGAANPRAPQSATPRLISSEKPPARKGTNTLTQFEYPAQPVLKKAAARKGRSAYAPRALSKASAEGKRKATHFREWLLVEVTGLELVTLCRLADDEPGCNREKEKALTFVSA